MVASAFASSVLDLLSYKGQLDDDDDFELHLIKALCFVARHSNAAKQQVLVTDNGRALLIAIGMNRKSHASMEARHLLRVLKESP